MNSFLRQFLPLVVLSCTAMAAEPPIVALTPQRGEIVLNGPWNFAPAGAKEADIASETWGQIWVPGSWQPHNSLPGLIREGTGEAWKAFAPKMESAWYEREVTIPADWAGRAILLDLARVHTGAVVFANGKECGSIAWPDGTVEITDAVKPGEKTVLRMRVDASDPEGNEVQLMGTGTAGDIVKKAELDGRGLVGDVVLFSRPKGAHVEDVFVLPSVREKSITLRTTIVESTGGKATFTARMLDDSGKVEQTFSKEVELKDAPTQTVDLTWKWEDPRLWDVRQPNLYTVQLDAAGAGLADSYPQRFGFREFWIDGPRFMLNGRCIGLRPTLAPLEVCPVPAAVDAAVESVIREGGNIQESWPRFGEGRGTRLEYGQWGVWIDSADRYGLLTMAPAPGFDITGEARGVVEWTAEKRRDYQAKIDRQLRRYRNHPSAVMWGLNANEFFFYDNENPRKIGRKNWQPPGAIDHRGYRFDEMIAAASDAIAALKEIDPTRPVYTHHGGYIGDVNTYNLYLNTIPLQEREDWLSEFSEHGEMPFIPIEFGTPVDAAFNRLRTSSHKDALSSEPLLTEHSTVYLGIDGYRTESNEYRDSIGKRYNPKTKRYDHWYDYNRKQFNSPNHMAYQDLFITNTWRSWRTWGTAGGMLPWVRAYAFNGPGGTVEMPPFEPGQRGAYRPEMPKGSCSFQNVEQGWIRTRAGEALKANNSPTLAWIAGAAPDFTSKDHLFVAGETVAKQLVVINDDTPEPRDYVAKWTATLEGNQIGGGELKGKIASGETLKLPIAFETKVTGNGAIRLEASIGDASHRDEFAFRVHAKPAPGKVTEVSVFDPEGVTTKWLESLEYKVTPWNGENVPLLIVGRNALSGGHPRPGDLEAYVENGGRLILSNQEQAWSESATGVRTSLHVTRRAWPVHASHPLTAGLDGEDFRDWRGAGTAFPKEVGTSLDKPERRWIAGWHWGNRGSVASSAVEKPHFSAWRPILEADFDLMYSPLMEASFGKGVMIQSALDLEGRTQREPMVEIFTRRLIDYAATRPMPKGVARVGYVGSEATRDFLASMGIESELAQLDGSDLVVAGPEATEEDLLPYTKKGVPIVMLARASEPAPFGVTLEKVEKFQGSLDVPDWPETEGLSASDLRLRTHAQWWILKSGCEIGADGLLGRKKVGESAVLYVQLDPAELQADALQYNRYTRWRQNRAIANLLANQGVAFAGDANVFLANPPSVSLAGLWKAKAVHKLDPVSPKNGHEDPGVSAEALALVATALDDSKWEDYEPTTSWPGFEEVDGDAVFRYTLDVPEEWAGKDLEVSLGAVDDLDDTYWNGELIGRTTADTPGYWAAKRRYTIPAAKVVPGKTILAIRAFDRAGGGGFSATPEELFVRVKPKKPVAPLYHPDYNLNHWDGDNPARWCPW